MAIADSHGLFWNSVGGDRKYDAESFERWLKKFFTSGVFANDMMVTAVSGMTVQVATGYSNSWGKVGFFETVSQLTLAVPNSTYPRIDTVVIERNDTDREVSLKIIQGQYTGANPQAPLPVRDETLGIYQLVLAQIYVGAGVSEVTQANITDTRANPDLCGIITGTVEELDFSQFVAQFNAYFTEWTASGQADFEAWFDHMKDQLDTDAAGHLQAEIDALSETVDVIVPTTGWSGEAPTYTNTINVQDITSTSQPFVTVKYPDGVTVAEKKAIGKAANNFVKMETGNGTVTITAVAIPVTEVMLELRGI